ncbi:aspartyl-phosphate phosphatase Spo0E family protein [Wukongibacter baidiensis]|uniref:aspartyl-phosphate phosphatase Spo0E family protein n=1 Tax=Wukongibacter baidiensis TaxID=1723361 RepID=UPI003D7F69A9
MLRLHKNRDLVNKINLLRRDLEKYLSTASKPTETEVVRMSQELDELLVIYYRQLGNIEKI